MKFFASIVFPLATVAATLASSVASCAAALDRRDGASPNTTNIVITSNNQQRSFLLWISTEYSPKVPASILLSFHGGGSNPTDQLQLDGFTTASANAIPIVVYPQGLNDTWQGVPGHTVNDVLFTHDMLNYLETNYNIDTTRIYASGKSDGGGFCNVLACDTRASQRIAAFAPVSGAFYVDTLPCDPDTVKLRSCHPGRSQVALIEFHGGNDTTICYRGGERRGECLPAIPHFVREWAVRNGLGVRNVTRGIAKHATWYAFGSGAEEGLVTHVFESDIGHDWPSTVPNRDNSRKGHHVASYNATPMILEFFGRYRLPK